MKQKIETIILIILLQIAVFCNSLPISTNSRWLVDKTNGKRVKLACVNWPSHIQPMIAEGLEMKPLQYLASQIAPQGFNCVRFTYATFMFTRPDYGNLTVSQSLDKLGLAKAKEGIAYDNPQVLNMKVVEVHKVVVDELGKKHLMVILDNHVSMPKWCCSDDDGNGFFGDESFDPKEWLQGLKAVATTYKGNSAVVGMSLRNELRGKRQNSADWYTYMQQGAAIVHDANPDFLVIVSGLSYAQDLSFLKSKPFGMNLNNKLVFEAHWYSFFGPTPNEWIFQTNKIYSAVTQQAKDHYLFLTEGNNSFPIFLSEFGIDQSGKNESDNRYITSLLAFVAENDLDWSLWSLQGSYMLREGRTDADESFGVMDFNWNGARNSSFMQRLQLIRHINHAYNSIYPTNYIMYHPLSGQCVNIAKDNLLLDSCTTAARWDHYEAGGTIKLFGNPRCLVVVGASVPANLSNDCSSNGSKWKSVTTSGLHLAAPDVQGKFLCLEDSPDGLVTNNCLCLDDFYIDASPCGDNPQTQWFKFIPTNV